MVEWRELAEWFNLRNGYTPSTNNPEYWEDGNIPWFRMEDIRLNGNILKDSLSHITEKGLKRTGLFPVNSIIIATSATIGEHALLLTEALSNQRFTNIYPKIEWEQHINMKYIHYYMFIVDEWCKNHTNSGGFASVDMKSLAKLPIPIPSLSEQNRIVGILDTFTASIDNLKQQIELRKKQYEYYINKSFGGTVANMKRLAEEGVYKLETLAQHGTFTRGRRFVRTDVVEEGQPCIHYGDMYTYYGLSASMANTHLPVDFPKKMRYAKKGDVVIVGAGENNEDIGVGLVWQGEEPAAVHDACYIYENDFEPMFVSYFLRSGIYHLQIKSHVVRGKICSISADGIGKAQIPVFPINKQKEIVSKLLPFEDLLSNLQQQLSHRQQQYEYYRNKLLTFE